MLLLLLAVATGATETRIFIDALSEIMMRSGAPARDRIEVLSLIAHLVTKVTIWAEEWKGKG